MKLAGLQKLTLLDFPGKLACTVFLSGCNFRCPFCYNAPLVFCEKEALDEMDEEEFFDFLKSRRGILEGVCITGGEPLMRDIRAFCEEIHKLDFQVKLDTNGAYPERLRELIDNGLLDYVAMDIKNAPERYGETVGVSEFDTRPIEESIALLKEGRVDYEFRTTVCREFHTPREFSSIATLLRGARRLFLQSYNDGGDHIGPALTAYNKEELEAFLPLLSPFVEKVEIRGI